MHKARSQVPQTETPVRICILFRTRYTEKKAMTHEEILHEGLFLRVVVGNPAPIARYTKVRPSFWSLDGVGAQGHNHQYERPSADKRSNHACARGAPSQE